MKPILLLPSILFSLCSIGFSQSYKPLVSENNSWSNVTYGLGSYFVVNHANTSSYVFKGDTTIQANNFKKVFCSNDSLKQNWKLIGFIRENVSSKEVWFRDTLNNEALIYNFSLNVGDSITLYSMVDNNKLYDNTTGYKVSKIDSMLIQSEYRKVYSLSHSSVTEKWIEGIGSEFGILNSNRFVPGSVDELLCFSDNKISYVNPKYHTCYKTKFTPQLTSKAIDTAFVNQYFSFQISTTEVFDYDTVTFSVAPNLPNGLQLDTKTGLISGTPTVTGTFHVNIFIINNNNVTDYLSTDLIVDFNTGNTDIKNKPGVKIYPNPTNNLLVIDCSGGSLYTVQLYDLNGKLLVDKVLTDNNSKTINLGSFKNGLYLIKVQKNGSRKIIFSDKLLIEK